MGKLRVCVWRGEGTVNGRAPGFVSTLTYYSQAGSLMGEQKGLLPAGAEVM